MQLIPNTIRWFFCAILIAGLCNISTAKIIYVDDDAAGANDGSSWENAYIYLQDALAEANTAENPIEIHVAQGIYKPDMGVGITPGDREESFRFSKGVMVKGGYAGIDANDPNARDIELCETILSGDLNSDDADTSDAQSLINHITREDNSYHICVHYSPDFIVVIDGLYITGGNSNVSGGGGAIVSARSNMHINNCTFEGNTCSNTGGAIFSRYIDELEINNCKFIRNASSGSSGAINIASNTTVNNCIFKENYSEVSGGAISIGSGTTLLADCIFENNLSYRGGGIFIDGEASLINCTFTGNKAVFGGAIYNFQSGNQYPYRVQSFEGCTFKENCAEFGGGIFNSGNENISIKNCLFVKNSSSNWGGAIHFWRSAGEILNCTLFNNSATRGSALCCGYEHVNSSSNVKINNCIIFNEIYNYSNSQITIDYTNLLGGVDSIEDPYNAVIWGVGNIDEDPCFADPGYWANVYDPNVIVEPNDPNAIWIDGDYHLKSQAGRFDPNSESWILDDVTSLCIDAGDPNSPVGEEPDPNGGRINMGAYGGTAEASKTDIIVYIQWLGHSSVKVWAENFIIYVDPQNLNESLHDATLVCVTHTHSDHYSPTDIAKVSNPDTQFMGPADVVQQYGSGQIILPEQTIDFNEVSITAVAAYNTNKTNHPKSNNWVGYIIEFGGKRVYVAGDTDLTDEMKALDDIDVAFLPAGGTYTMNATEAAEATQYIRPNLAIPYHWGQGIGNINDAQTFVELAYCPAMILEVGETISSENWPVYSPLIAHWKFDETDGDIAIDSARDNDGVLEGEPLWQPDGGMVNGALEFDGIDDYVATPYVLNPGTGQFSIFAWIKGGLPGQTIISQADGANWLVANTSDGALMTELKGGGRTGSVLVSQTIITDDNWHRVGLTWDGTNRILYVDDIVVAQDTQANLLGSEGGLYIGAGKGLDADSFFYGLIDDVQIYNRAITP